MTTDEAAVTPAIAQATVEAAKAAVQTMAVARGDSCNGCTSHTVLY